MTSHQSKAPSQPCARQGTSPNNFFQLPRFLYRNSATCDSFKMQRVWNTVVRHPYIAINAAIGREHPYQCCKHNRCSRSSGIVSESKQKVCVSCLASNSNWSLHWQDSGSTHTEPDHVQRGHILSFGALETFIHRSFIQFQIPELNWIFQTAK